MHAIQEKKDCVGPARSFFIRILTLPDAIFLIPTGWFKRKKFESAPHPAVRFSPVEYSPFLTQCFWYPPTNLRIKKFESAHLPAVEQNTPPCWHKVLHTHQPKKYLSQAARFFCHYNTDASWHKIKLFRIITKKESNADPRPTMMVGIYLPQKICVIKDITPTIETTARPFMQFFLIKHGAW